MSAEAQGHAPSPGAPAWRTVAFGFPASLTSGTLGTAIPPRLVALARRRLERLGWLLAALGLAVLLPVALGVLPGALVSPMLVTTAVSLALVFTARAEKLSAQTRLRMGLGGLVAYCVIFSFLVAQARLREYGVPGDATWTCVLLVAFPILVPTRPRETVVALALGALSAPAGVWWLGQRVESFEVSAIELIGFSLSPTAAAVIGYMGSRFVFRLGQDVERAVQLGNYRLIRKIGEGGMGEVWEARHARLARPAAIKFIGGANWTPSADDADLQRFVREASLTASLRSPHTIEVFDFGVSEDGRFYYAMELLEGEDLHTLVEREGPLPVRRAIHFALQVLRSLEEAHARGMVHRDIKPANIFICRYGLEEDFVKVLDFGLVRELHDDAEHRLTREHRLQGTPAFMPPESALGDDMDERGDLYAIACVIWWMLCAQPPFGGSTPMAQLFAQVHDDPGALSEKCPAPVPQALDATVADALRKNPAARIQTASDFIRRLEAVQRMSGGG